MAVRPFTAMFDSSVANVYCIGVQVASSGVAPEAFTPVLHPSIHVLLSQHSPPLPYRNSSPYAARRVADWLNEQVALGTIVNNIGIWVTDEWLKSYQQQQQKDQARPPEHVRVADIQWDCDGYDPGKDCQLPRSILLINAPRNWNSEAYREKLGEVLMETYGFKHYGFRLEVYPLDRYLAGAAKTRTRSAGIEIQGLMEAPQ